VRTVYGITAKGRLRFQELLHQRFAGKGSVAAALYSAMLFLHLSDLETVARLLRKRIDRTEIIQELIAVRKRLAPVLSTGNRWAVTCRRARGDVS